MTYDVRGRKTQLKDPDLGTWTYEYDNLSQLTKQTNAKNQAQAYTFDKLGRKTKQESTDLISEWWYESNKAGTIACSKGIGKLCEATTNKGYSRKVSYDGFGRLAGTNTTIDAGSSYDATWSYDAAGRLSSTTYPDSGTAGAPLRFKVAYGYTNHGYLKQVSNATPGQPATVFWIASSKNADGNTLKETFGNGIITNYSYDSSWGRLASIQGSATGGTPFETQNQSYTFDKLGNLSTRTDAIAGINETFGYDNLNRLTSASLTGGAGVVASGGTLTQGISYDAIGNIKTKTSNVAGYNIGTYSYNPSGTSSTRPHAVSAVTGSVNGTTNPSYGYDANGNLETGAGKTVTWTTFNMVNTLSNAGGTATFQYGPEQQRTVQSWPNTTSPSSKTIYLFDPHYEKDIQAVTEHKHYITTGSGYGGRLIAQYTRRSNGSEDTKYFHTDHLNSTSVVTNSTGFVLERLAYDPWGDRRASGTGTSSAGTADATNAIIPSTTDRGYTGHEGLDAGAMGLVHMNGRIYDPTLARFMSTDPIIQSPYSTQSFNRYSYVWNNPLSATDPSGFASDFWFGGSISGRIVVTASRCAGTCYTGAAARESLENGLNEQRQSLSSQIAERISKGAQQFANGAAYYKNKVSSFFGGLIGTQNGITNSTSSSQDGKVESGQATQGEAKAGEEALDADCGKGCPNPDGRNGGPEHQANVEDAKRGLEQKYPDDPKVEVRTEVRVPTPGGEKENRYLDVAAVDKETGRVVEGVQVGRETQSGNPVAREQRALNDIRGALPGVNVEFRPYNRR
jgi:RHS repeat-associated protein